VKRLKKLRKFVFVFVLCVSELIVEQPLGRYIGHFKLGDLIRIEWLGY
jgi:hypothetical protein